MEITEERYRELVRAEEKLDALEAWGVDNWEGYGDAMADLKQQRNADQPPELRG